MDARPEPALSPEDQAAFRRGVEEFNAGLYFECHDTLEEVWSGVRGPGRDFFQGLIQVAVACYHLSNGNAGGARSLFERALRRLEPYPERYLGIDLGSVRSETVETLARLVRGDTVAPERPRWSWTPGVRRAATEPLD